MIHILYTITICVLCCMCYILKHTIRTTCNYDKFYRTPSTNKTRYIPPIILKTGPKKYIELPESVKELFKETLKNNSQYEIKYFSDECAVNFLSEHYSKKTVNAFKKIKAGAFKADLLRYALLYEYGGVYSDLTQQFLKPLDTIVPLGEKLVLPKDRTLFFQPGIQISFMAAEPGNILFKNALDKAVYNINNEIYTDHCLAMTGPVMFERQLCKYIDVKCNGYVTPYIRYCQGDDFYLMDIKTRELIIKLKLKDHNKSINKNLLNSYVVLWLTRRLF